MWNNIKSEIKRENKVTAPKSLERLQMTQEKKMRNTGKNKWLLFLKFGW